MCLLLAIFCEWFDWLPIVGYVSWFHQSSRSILFSSTHCVVLVFFGVYFNVHQVENFELVCFICQGGYFPVMIPSPYSLIGDSWFWCTTLSFCLSEKGEPFYLISSVDTTIPTYTVSAAVLKFQLTSYRIFCYACQFQNYSNLLDLGLNWPLVCW